MRRLLLAAIVALGLHGLLLSTGGDWLKRRIPSPLPTRPLALALLYKSPKKELSLPRPRPESIQKLSLPHLKKEEREPPRPKPPKETRKPVQRTEPRKRPKFVDAAKRPAPPVKKARPQPERVPEPLPDFDDFPLTPAPPPPPPAEPLKGPFTDAALPTGEDVDAHPSPPPLREAFPIYRVNPPPEYPRIARRRGYEGTVILGVLVNPEGKVDDCRILRTSGHPVLDRAALRSVRRWAFEPAKRGEKKVEMWIRVPIRFELR